MWIGFIILVPIGYIIAWILVIIGPISGFIFTIAFSPFMALRCPYVALKHNILRPGRMKKSLKIGFWEPIVMMKELDRITGKFCLGGWILFKQGQSMEEREEEWKQGVMKIEYWDLFLARVIKCKNEALTRRWISKEDVDTAMPNVMVCLPGMAILDILTDSVRRESCGGAKGLVWFDEEHQCNDSNRDMLDNYIKHYWPKLDKVKESLRKLHTANAKGKGKLGNMNEDCEKGIKAPEQIPLNSMMLNNEMFYMQARLCAGGSEQSTELKAALTREGWDQGQELAMNRLCSQVADIVYSLLRTEVMQRRMMEVLA